MRGKHTPELKNTPNGGITPADAGKTFCLPSLRLSNQDHPRGCGENVCRLRRLISKPGSPPRMRGKPSREEVTFFFPRITPADAGKTKTEKGEPKKEQDHPRGCGENLSICNFEYRQPGSPPRMRGKR